MKLIEILKMQSAFNSLPQEQKEIFAVLATEFEDTIDLAVYLTPQELTYKLGIGNPAQWQEFLQLEAVQQFIKGQMSFNAQVASRKSLQSLAKEAVTGDVQAAKAVNELAGLYNKQETQKVVVLHRVNRPKEEMPKTDESTN